MLSEMPFSDLDIKKNRDSKKYKFKENILRVLWCVCQPFVRYSPRIFFSWRRFVLRVFGARVGVQVHIYNSAVIYMPWNLEIGDWSSIGEYVFVYNLGQVKIGSKVTISHRAHLCAGTHDYSRADLPLQKPPITIVDQAWVCADAFVGPGVVVGEGAIVAARAVVIKDVPPWTVVAGNPARVVKQREMVKYEG